METRGLEIYPRDGVDVRAGSRVSTPIAFRMYILSLYNYIIYIIIIKYIIYTIKYCIYYNYVYCILIKYILIYINNII